LIKDILLQSNAAAQRRYRVNQHIDANPDPEPKDARKATEDQKQLQDQLEHQEGDSDGPGMQQTGGDIADESTR
jgi:hypothetical protein